MYCSFCCSLFVFFARSYSRWNQNICFFPPSDSTISYCNLSFFIHLICIMDIIFSNMNINLQEKKRMNTKNASRFRVERVIQTRCMATMYVMQKNINLILSNNLCKFLLEFFQHWHSVFCKRLLRVEN